MAQPRVEDAFVGTVTAGEILEIPAPNVAKTVERRFKRGTKEVITLVDEKGRVVAQKIILGDRPMWGFRREIIEEIKKGKKRG